MASGKSRTSNVTIPEELVEDAPGSDAVEQIEGSKPVETGNKDDTTSEQQKEQQQAVATLIQGVAIAQAKGGCWSIKQASILNSAIKQLTGNADPGVLPAFDPTETPSEGLPPAQRCVIYLIQATGFGQAKGAFTLEQAAILDGAIDVLTTEKNAA